MGQTFTRLREQTTLLPELGNPSGCVLSSLLFAVEAVLDAAACSCLSAVVHGNTDRTSKQCMQVIAHMCHVPEPMMHMMKQGQAICYCSLLLQPVTAAARMRSCCLPHADTEQLTTWETLAEQKAKLGTAGSVPAGSYIGPLHQLQDLWPQTCTVSQHQQWHALLL